MRVFLAWAVMASTAFAQTFGAWELNPGRYTLSGSVPPKSFVLRIEPHRKGEIFTVNTVETDGRRTSSSSILYLDGTPRDFQDFQCSGTQSSWWMDSQTVEILRQCGNGEWTMLIRRASTKPNELILEITEKHLDGRRFERRLMLEKQRREREQ
jgi:hypothetical protein